MRRKSAKCPFPNDGHGSVRQTETNGVCKFASVGYESLMLNVQFAIDFESVTDACLERHRKRTTNLVPHIDIRKCKRHPDLLPEDWILYDKRSSVSVFHRWKSGSDPFEILFEEIDGSSILNVPTCFTPCTFGSERPWFSCPEVGCGQRVAILYFHPLGLLCRKCANLSYASQYEDKQFRQLRRANKLRLQLGGQRGLTSPIPRKPRYMHWLTYQKLYFEIVELEFEAVYDFRDRAYTRLESLLERVGAHATL